MDLNLERPLVFFDIESTGLNIASDSIIELSFVKIHPGARQEVKTWRVKPWDYERQCQRPINPSAQAVHGISAEDLADCPTFYQIVDEVIGYITDSDLAGFNSAKFDLPMLAEEIERVRKFTGKDIQINLHEMKMVDVQNIFHMMEPRTLKAAYMFYCGRDLENAHAAEADTLATYEVLLGQLERYSDLENDVDFLAEYSSRGATADFAGRIAYNDKQEEIFTFGKYKGRKVVDIFQSEPSYYSWIMNGDFPNYTKKVFTEIYLRMKKS